MDSRRVAGGGRAAGADGQQRTAGLWNERQRNHEAISSYFADLATAICSQRSLRQPQPGRDLRNGTADCDCCFFTHSDTHTITHTMCVCSCRSYLSRINLFWQINHVGHAGSVPLALLCAQFE